MEYIFCPPVECRNAEVAIKVCDSVTSLMEVKSPVFRLRCCRIGFPDCSDTMHEIDANLCTLTGLCVGCIQSDQCSKYPRDIQIIGELINKLDKRCITDSLSCRCEDTEESTSSFWLQLYRLEKESYQSAASLLQFTNEILKLYAITAKDENNISDEANHAYIMRCLCGYFSQNGFVTETQLYNSTVKGTTYSRKIHHGIVQYDVVTISNTTKVRHVSTFVSDIAKTLLGVDSENCMEKFKKTFPIHVSNYLPVRGGDKTLRRQRSLTVSVVTAVSNYHTVGLMISPIDLLHPLGSDIRRVAIVCETEKQTCMKFKLMISGYESLAQQCYFVRLHKVVVFNSHRQSKSCPHPIVTRVKHVSGWDVCRGYQLTSDSVVDTNFPFRTYSKTFYERVVAIQDLLVSLGLSDKQFTHTNIYDKIKYIPKSREIDGVVYGTTDNMNTALLGVLNMYGTHMVDFNKVTREIYDNTKSADKLYQEDVTEKLRRSSPAKNPHCDIYNLEILSVYIEYTLRAALATRVCRSKDIEELTWKSMKSIPMCTYHAVVEIDTWIDNDRQFKSTMPTDIPPPLAITGDKPQLSMLIERGLAIVYVHAKRPCLLASRN